MLAFNAIKATSDYEASSEVFSMGSLIAASNIVTGLVSSSAIQATITESSFASEHMEH